MKNFAEKYKGKSVLVTGACGFIGGHLLSILLPYCREIHATDLQRDDSQKSAANLHWHRADIRDGKEISRIVGRAKPDFIFHLAAKLPRYGDATINEMLEVNFIGTLNLLRALEKVKFSKMVFMGSAAEYGIAPVSHKEDQELRPVNPYGVSKAAATQLCLAHAKKYNYPIVILRPTTVYGCGEAGRIFLPAFLLDAINHGKSFEVKTGYKRDFLYVDDLVEAILLAGIKKARGVIVNIGTGKSISQRSAAQLTKKLLRSGAKIKGKLPGLCDILDDSCDVSRAEKLLGWKARYSLEEGLKKTLNWRSK